MNDNERKDCFISNGLYTTSKVLLKRFKDGTLDEEQYITESRKLFDLYEKLKEQNNE